jgi:hypothetical protein
MNPSDPANSRVPPAEWLIAALLCVVGAVSAWPHLADPPWHDEVATLVQFASGRWTYPFLDYSIPNNHVLFSVLLTLWKDAVGTGTAALRALPLASFVAATLTLFVAIRQWVACSGGRSVALASAILAVVLFTQSHAVLNFALQLRGYCLSWIPVTAAVWAWARWSAGPATASRSRWLWLYALAGALAVGTLPTNLVIFALFGAVIVAGSLLDRGAAGDGEGRPPRWQALALAASPLAGLAFYAAVWPSFVANAQHAWNPSDRWTSALDYAQGVYRDSVLLLPLAAVGLALLWRRARADRRWTIVHPRGALLFAVAVLAGPFAAFALAPNVPFARNFVPLLGVHYGLVSWLVVLGLSALIDAVALRRGLQAGGAVLAVTLLLAATATAVAVLREARLREPKVYTLETDTVQTLYDQYFLNEYDPEAMAAMLARRVDLAREDARGRARAYPSTSDFLGFSFRLRRQRGAAPTLVADYCDFPALALVYSRLPQSRLAPLVYSEDEAARARVRQALAEGAHADSPVYLVSCSVQRAALDVEAMGLDNRTIEVRPVGDTGFFKLYELRRASR